MQFTPGPLKGLILIDPQINGDQRGYFLEFYQREKFIENGIIDTFIQDNESSSQKNTVRGLHWQSGQYAQSKLVRVIHGEVYDVAVDLRPESETFGKWFGILLSGENKKMMYIPVGFAHGFCVTSDEATFMYKCGALYAPQNYFGVRWDDPDISIDWPIDHSKAILSEKDAQLPLLKDIKEKIIW